jgi:hypothetical protein
MQFSEASRLHRAVAPIRLTQATSLALAYAGIATFYLVSRITLLPRFPPFIDETTFATWVQRGYTHPAERLLSVSAGREPLFIWLGMFGMKAGFDPITALRVVSLLAGIVTILFTALIAVRLGGRRMGVTAAAIYAILPFVFVHDVIGIMDPLVTAITAVALYLQLRLAEEQRLDLALLLGLTFAAGVLTKQTADIAIVLIPLGLLLFRWHRPERSRRVAAWAVAMILAVGMARLAYFILSLNPDYYRLGQIRATLGQHRPIHDVVHHSWSALSANVPGLLRAYEGYLTWPFIALLVAGIGFGWRSQRRLTIVLLAWAAAPFVFAAFLSLLAFPRYLLSSLPPLVALASLGAVRGGALLAARLPKLSVPRIVVFAAVTLALASPALAFDARVELDPNRTRYPGLDDVQYARGWPSGNGWVAFIGELQHLAPHGVTVAVASFVTFSNVVDLRLPEADGYFFVPADSAAGRHAPFLVQSQIPATDRGDGSLREIWRYDRPRGGPPVILFARGFRVNGRFEATPNDVRAALGLSTPAFDRWLRRHPRIEAWAKAQPA